MPRLFVPLCAIVEGVVVIVVVWGGCIVGGMEVGRCHNDDDDEGLFALLPSHSGLCVVERTSREHNQMESPDDLSRILVVVDSIGQCLK